MHIASKISSTDEDGDRSDYKKKVLTYFNTDIFQSIASQASTKKIEMIVFDILTIWNNATKNVNIVSVSPVAKVKKSSNITKSTNYINSCIYR